MNVRGFNFCELKGHVRSKTQIFEDMNMYLQNTSKGEVDEKVSSFDFVPFCKLSFLFFQDLIGTILDQVVSFNFHLQQSTIFAENASAEELLNLQTDVLQEIMLNELRDEIKVLFIFSTYCNRFPRSESAHMAFIDES